MQQTKTVILRLFLACLLIVSLSTVANAATTGKITGRVLEEGTNDPLVGAAVMIEGTTLGAATDVEGFYFILNVPPGAYNLRATMMGYTSIIQQNVSVNINQKTTANFYLAIQTIEGETVVIEASRHVVQMDVY